MAIQSIEGVPLTSEPVASWVAIGSLSVGAFALVTSEFLPVGLLPAIASDVEISYGQTGLLVTLPAIFAALAAPLSMHFAAGMERKRVLLILLSMLLASNIVVAFADNLPVILFGRALLGVAIGGFWTIAGALGPRLRKGPDGVRASAVILGGVSLGTVAGLPAGALLGELFGWRFAFGAGGLLAAISIAAIMLLMPKVAAPKTAGLRDMLVIMSGWPARIALIAAAIMYSGTFGAYTYVAPYLSETTGISGETLSAVLLANGIAGFAGNIFGGWLAGRSPHVSVLATAAIAIVSILLLTIAGGNPLVTMTLVTFWGFSLGMQAISLQSWLFTTAPERRDAMQALFVSLTQLAIGLGSLTGGIIVDHVGTGGAMLEGAVAAMITLVMAAFATGRIRPKSESAFHDVGCECR